MLPPKERPLFAPTNSIVLTLVLCPKRPIFALLLLFLPGLVKGALKDEEKRKDRWKERRKEPCPKSDRRHHVIWGPTTDRDYPILRSVQSVNDFAT